MKISVPTISSYEELKTQFSGHLIPVAEMKRTGKTISPALEKKQQEVLAVIEKNKIALEEIEDILVEFAQYVVLEDPTVYIARTRDAKTDIEYFTAKTSWPLKGGKKKEVKIYLGKAEDYKNDTQSLLAKKEATVKMQQTLARRMREGTL